MDDEIGARMGPVLWLQVLAAGACLYEALHKSVLVMFRWDAIRAMLGTLFAIAAAYLILLAIASSTSNTALATQLLRAGALLLTCGAVLLAWTIRRFSGRAIRNRHRALVFAWIGLVTLEITLSGGFMFRGGASTVPLTFPWGESVFLHLANTPEVGLAVAMAMLGLMSALWDIRRINVATWGWRGLLAKRILVALLALLVIAVISRAFGFLPTALFIAPAFAAVVLTLTWALRARRLEQTADRLARLNALANLSSRSNTAFASDDDAVEDLAEAARHLLAVDRVSFWRLEGEEHLRSCAVMDVRGEDFELPMVLRAKSLPSYFASLRQNTVLAASDSVRDPRFNELVDSYLRPMGIRSTLDMAIHSGGRIVGLCCVESCSKERVWDEDEVTFLAALSAIAGERWASLSQSRSSKVLSSLAGATSESGAGDFFELTVREVASMFEADIAFIGEVEKGGERVHAFKVWRSGQPSEPFHYDLPGTPCSGVIGGGACCYPAGAAERFPEAALLREFKIDAYCAAAFFEADVQGVVVVLRRSPMAEDASLSDAMRIIAARVGSEMQRLRVDERIRRLAFEDAMTGLPTRPALCDEIAAQLDRSSPECPGALLLINLDRFKVINDALSHEIGDDFLRQLAIDLRADCGGGESIARLVGDEFGVMLPATSGLNDSKVIARAQALLGVIEKPRVVGTRTVAWGASIGAAFFDGRQGVSEVIRRSQSALRHSKSTGRARATLYHSQLDVALSRRLAISEALRSALSKGQLSLYLQPKVDAVGLPVGAEALLRWTHPELGEISPAEFIPIAEESGVIAAMGQWALRETCRAFHVLSAEMDPSRYFNIAVNVSAWQLTRPEFEDEVGAILCKEGVPPSWITLEVTESLVLHDLDEVIRKLEALRSSGFRISLDDFGTGYSSLSYLRQLPLDELKIDRSFTRDVLEERNHALVRSIVAIGEHMGLAVVAEGVETELHAERLVALGCHIFQGYLYARPMPVKGFGDWLQQCRASA